jgi:hypothetical protein
MSLVGMPILILNLGGEMIYILDQVRRHPCPQPPHGCRTPAQCRNHVAAVAEAEGTEHSRG